jgi:O-antigen/teichoic acid export membrane protein
MNKSNPSEEIGAGAHMLRGSAWMIGLRWAIRLTGLVSTIILARLLTPKDFGVVAIAMIVVGMFEMLSATGQGLALIRYPEPTREHYDTAWSTSVAIGFGIGAAIFLVAPLTNFYFHDERTILVMQCLALRAVLSGFENIGIIDFRRNLTFNRFFLYNFYAKIVSFLVTITLAILLRNYWALVAGTLCGQLARTVLSYAMHSYRPKFSFAKMSDIWSFSIWVFIRSIGSYFLTQVDAIAVGGATGTSSMGRYTVAKDLAASPTDEIVVPMVAVLFPVMARLQHDAEQLRQLYLRALSWASIIGTSTGVGIWLVAPDVVPLILGPKWVDIVPLVGWLALTSGVGTLNSCAYQILDALGRPHLGARLQWLRVVVLAAAVFPAIYLTRDLVTLVIVRLLATVLLIPPLLAVVGRHCGVTPRDYYSAFWRPFAAGGVMALVVLSLNQALEFSGIVRLGLDATLGGVLYVGTLMALWNLSGRPTAAAERDVVTLINHSLSMLGAIRARVLNAVQ